MIYSKKNIIMNVLMIMLLISLNKCTISSTIFGNEFPGQTTDNTVSVSLQNASMMIIPLKKNQQFYVPKLQDGFFNYGVIQRTLTKDYRSTSTDTYINEMQDEAIKDLLLARRNRGLKI